jgi:hypothetical protein
MDTGVSDSLVSDREPEITISSMGVDAFCANAEPENARAIDKDSGFRKKHPEAQGRATANAAAMRDGDMELSRKNKKQMPSGPATREGPNVIDSVVQEKRGGPRAGSGAPTSAAMRACVMTLSAKSSEGARPIAN